MPGFVALPRRVRKVACGERILCCVDEHGVAFSQRPQQAALEVVPCGPVLLMACGMEHCLLLLDNGDVGSLGGNNAGQCGVGSDVAECSFGIVCRGARHAACGVLHSVVCDLEGAVWFAGWRAYGQDGGGAGDGEQRRRSFVRVAHSEPVASAACGLFHTLLLGESGRVAALGYDSDGQLGVDGEEDVAQIAAGRRHSAVLHRAGTTRVAGFGGGEKECWGGGEGRVERVEVFGWTTVLFFGQ